ncbi:hypothetical protein WN943_015381 [Citrus x changshan-huyou]
MLWKENYYNGLNIDKCHAPRVSIRHFMERLENLRSVEVSFGGGIIPGGVVALLNAWMELEKRHDAATTGFGGSAIVENLLKQDNPDIGFDPARGE